MSSTELEQARWAIFVELIAIKRVLPFAGRMGLRTRHLPELHSWARSILADQLPAAGPFLPDPVALTVSLKGRVGPSAARTVARFVAEEFVVEGDQIVERWFDALNATAAGRLGRELPFDPATNTRILNLIRRRIRPDRWDTDLNRSEAQPWRGLEARISRDWEGRSLSWVYEMIKRQETKRVIRQITGMMGGEVAPLVEWARDALPGRPWPSASIPTAWIQGTP
jgi:hypothetical protein